MVAGVIVGHTAALRDMDVVVHDADVIAAIVFLLMLVGLSASWPVSPEEPTAVHKNLGRMVSAAML